MCIRDRDVGAEEPLLDASTEVSFHLLMHQGDQLGIVDAEDAEYLGLVLEVVQ